MTLVEFRMQRLRFRPFSSALVSTAQALAGVFLLGWIASRHSALIPGAVLFFLAVLVLLAVQFSRIRRVYSAARLQAESDDTLARTLTELLRTYQWGCTLFLILAVAAVWAASTLR